MRILVRLVNPQCTRSQLATNFPDFPSLTTHDFRPNFSKKLVRFCNQKGERDEILGGGEGGRGEGEGRKVGKVGRKRRGRLFSLCYFRLPTSFFLIKTFIIIQKFLGSNYFLFDFRLVPLRHNSCSSLSSSFSSSSFYHPVFFSPSFSTTFSFGFNKLGFNILYGYIHVTT